MNKKEQRCMLCTQVTHHLDYHGEAITEIRYIFAASMIEALDIMSAHIHPLRVLTELYSISIEKNHED
ncbi:hypothetical protein [Paenibacillus agricola]|nr:hypothetical protein [Paenibacillus agricola]